MRILLAVGCNEYDNPPLSPLNGAVNDARTIFRHLVSEGWGDYDNDKSQLLESPTLAEVQAAIASVLFDHGPLDELTIFFAGHGGTKDDAYFMCLRDTDVARLSVSALSMSQLFTWLNEAKVRQTNIVIDACQSGGVTRDIGQLLNPNIVGKSGSPSFSILAASAADETASEVGGRGVCTAALMECLTGKVTVQTGRAALDLIEVGRTVSELLEEQPQSPVSWGLNLYGRGQFAKNPLFAGGAPHISTILPSLSTDPAASDFLRERSDAIWELYISLGRGFDAAAFVSQIAPICEEFYSNPTVLAPFMDGIAETFGARLRRAEDVFEEPLLYAACVALLLGSSDPTVSGLAEELTRRFCGAMGRACSSLLKQLEDEEYALLGGGQSDLYFLPLRILSVLGWIGAFALVDNWLDGTEPQAMVDATKLVNLVVEKYAGSIVAVSEEQAASFLTLFAARQMLDCEEDAESVLSLLFADLCRTKGAVAKSGASGSEAFTFIAARATGNYADCDEVLARPSALLPALLLAYGALGIPEIADRCMRDLDHLSMNMFVPTTHADFLAESIEGGQNHSFQIGFNIWRVSELQDAWLEIVPEIFADTVLATRGRRAGALFASLLKPDRQPWFVLVALPPLANA